jgi:hypothetical protein
MSIGCCSSASRCAGSWLRMDRSFWTGSRSNYRRNTSRRVLSASSTGQPVATISGTFTPAYLRAALFICLTVSLSRSAVPWLDNGRMKVRISLRSGVSSSSFARSGARRMQPGAVARMRRPPVAPMRCSRGERRTGCKAPPTPSPPRPQSQAWRRFGSILSRSPPR